MARKRGGWFRNAFLALLLVILAVWAVRELIPELGWSYHSKSGAWYEEYSHWWRRADGEYGPGRLGAWKGMFACPTEQRWVETRLYMGRETDGDKLDVSDADWNRFLDAEIRTRLPDGFSVADVYGFSSVDNPNHEKWTKVLILLHDGSDEKRAVLDEITDAFLEQTNQRWVLRSEKVACVEFIGGEG